MKNLEKPIKIQVIPYHKKDEDMSGRKTLLLLYSNKLEYKVKFEFKIKVDNEITGEDKINLYVDDEGFINKSHISSISKFIDNDTSEGKTDKRPVVEVSYNGGQLCISCLTEEERNKVYEQLNSWYWNE